MAYSFYLMRGLDHFGQSRKLLTGSFMTNQHPITPPPELVREWCAHSNKHETYDQFWNHIATSGAQWGADQELEACCEYVYERLKLTTIACIAQNLRAARRPKPPSLKEQALTALHAIATGANDTRELHQDLETICRALESIND